MNGINQTFLSSAQIMDRYITAGKVNQSQETWKTNSFQDALLEAMESSRETTLKFSKHASSRLADRNIELTKEQMDRLTQGTNKAGSKGIKDSLVMVDHLAFIVNIPKNTVITAMDQSQADQTIFTNIDGAVIA